MTDYALFKSNKARKRISCRCQALAEQLAVGVRRSEGPGDETDSDLHKVSQIYSGGLRIEALGETPNPPPPEEFAFKAEYRGGDPALPGLYSEGELEIGVANLMRYIFRCLSSPEDMIVRLSFSMRPCPAAAAKEYDIVGKCNHEQVSVDFWVFRGGQFISSSTRVVKLQRR